MKRKARKPNSGCAYVLLVGVIIIALFAFNMLVVRSMFEAMPASEDQRFRQFVQLVFPVALIFVEFWIFDFLTDMLDRRIT